MGSCRNTEKERRGERMKYLVVGEYNPDNMNALAKKAKEYDEDKEKHPGRYPDAPVPAHFMLNKAKFMAIWDTDDQEQIANKIAFMLPEVKYEVIPLLDGRTFLKQYMEIKK
jgi:hypothetical protein